jgi:AcrR family transcriptional regulator
MPEKSTRRSNKARTAATRAALIEAARDLFIQKGYAETSTPEIARAADVTRGALYHHFDDKQALFRAVVEQESAAVAREIDDAAPADADVESALLQGGAAFLRAMAEPGRTRLLLLDGPAILGRPEMDRIDLAHAARTLREGLAAAINARAIAQLPLDPLTALLSAAFDRAALAIADGRPAEEYQQAIEGLIRGLMR